MNKQQYQVLWSDTARQDLQKIVEFISPDSTIRAKRIYLDIKQKAGSLHEMPKQGRIVPELQHFNILAFRELLLPPWRIIYRIEENKVSVIAVIDGRRNVEDILLDRFLY